MKENRIWETEVTQKVSKLKQYSWEKGDMNVSMYLCQKANNGREISVFNQNSNFLLKKRLDRKLSGSPA